MIYQLTRSQAIQIMTNVINAAKPVGMGIYHYEFRDYTPEVIDIELFDSHGYYADYFRGRQVKFGLKRINDDLFEMDFQSYNPSYQSWADVYPDTSLLLGSILKE
jgi:hypothetical protein